MEGRERGGRERGEREGSTDLAGKGEYLVKPNIHHYHLKILTLTHPLRTGVSR